MSRLVKLSTNFPNRRLTSSATPFELTVLALVKMSETKRQGLNAVCAAESEAAENHAVIIRHRVNADIGDDDIVAGHGHLRGSPVGGDISNRRHWK